MRYINALPESCRKDASDRDVCARRLLRWRQLSTVSRYVKCDGLRAKDAEKVGLALCVGLRDGGGGRKRKSDSTKTKGFKHVIVRWCHRVRKPIALLCICHHHLTAALTNRFHHNTHLLHKTIAPSEFRSPGPSNSPPSVSIAATATYCAPSTRTSLDEREFACAFRPFSPSLKIKSSL
jgi:hypothetical protein